MRSFILSIFCSITILQSSAQNRLPVALIITNTPEEIENGVAFKVGKPEAVNIKESQTFVCKGVYKNAASDTAAKGNGISVIINADYIVCTIKKTNMVTMPQKGDVCYFLVDGLNKRKDVFNKLARFSISFRSITDSVIFDAGKSLGTWSDNRTNAILKSMVADIKYTGKVMQEQNDSQQQTINDGDYNGKPLFTAMQQIGEKDVLEFVKYVWARPTKYIGNTWNTSEVFATWMTSETPKYNGTIE